MSTRRTLFIGSILSLITLILTNQQEIDDAWILIFVLTIPIIIIAGINALLLRTVEKNNFSLIFKCLTASFFPFAAIMFFLGSDIQIILIMSKLVIGGLGLTNIIWAFSLRKKAIS